MQRRDLLKLLIPVALVPVVGYAGWRLWRQQRTCENPGVAAVIQRLQPFADPELGRLAKLEPPAQWWLQYQGVCPGDFVSVFRERVATDFAAGRVVRIDGWILSETEAFTHRAVYLAGASQGGVTAP